MTQYHDLVRRMRYKLKAEAWAKEIKMIYGQRADNNDWIVTTTYNNESFLGEGMTVIAAKNKIRKIWNLTSQEVEDIVEEQEQFLKDDSLGELV
jgi:MinD-like ATPase involved in chromosome partitioning or flagellar assembly